MKPFARLFACLAVLLPMLAGAPDARAQAPYTDDRFPHLFAPQDQRPRIFTLPPVQSRPSAPRVARPPESVRPPSRQAAHEREVAPTTFILVLGDNIAEWLASGLEAAFEDVPELGVTDRTRLSSGLVRTEVYDWPKAIGEILAQQAKVDFIVMQIGSNDRQAIRIDAETVEPRSERWRELYAQRVDAAMKAMKAGGVPVYWVGMPPLRGQRLSADMAYLNDIYKERAAANGVTYIDVWNGFVDEQGQYTQFGPDFAGQIRRLRTSDGVHFTAAGARKLAVFVEPDLRRDLVGRLTPAAPAGLPVAPEATAPEPEPARPRPLAGPVLPLAGNPALPAPVPEPQAAGLAGERPPAPAQGAAAAVLVRGEEAPPVAGRADDFRWPKPAAAGSAEAVPPRAGGAAEASR